MHDSGNPELLSNCEDGCPAGYIRQMLQEIFNPGKNGETDLIRADRHSPRLEQTNRPGK